MLFEIIFGAKGLGQPLPIVIQFPLGQYRTSV